MSRSLLGLGLVLVVGLVASCGGKRDEHAPLRTAAAEATRGDEMSEPRPILTVRNLEASERYYRDVLGFRVDWEDGDPPDFASVSRARAVLFMC